MTPRSTPVRPLRVSAVPVMSVVAGSALALLPVVAEVPALPPIGLLLLLGWRLLRPELWPAWVGLPLGLADDLIGGAPLGQAAALWTLALLAIDIADHRLPWRDHLTDWALAAPLILGVQAGSWAITRLVGGGGPLWAALIPAFIGLLAFPLATRLCVGLDHWRLRR